MSVKINVCTIIYTINICAKYFSEKGLHTGQHTQTFGSFSCGPCRIFKLQNLVYLSQYFYPPKTKDQDDIIYTFFNVFNERYTREYINLLVKQNIPLST